MGGGGPLTTFQHDLKLSQDTFLLLWHRYW